MNASEAAAEATNASEAMGGTNATAGEPGLAESAAADIRAVPPLLPGVTVPASQSSGPALETRTPRAGGAKATREELRRARALYQEDPPPRRMLLEAVSAEPAAARPEPEQPPRPSQAGLAGHTRAALAEWVRLAGVQVLGVPDESARDGVRLSHEPGWTKQHALQAHVLGEAKRKQLLRLAEDSLQQVPPEPLRPYGCLGSQ
jgi:hypothetical protein